MNTTIAGSLLIALALGLASGGAMAEPTGQFRFADQVRLVTMDPARHSGGGVDDHVADTRSDFFLTVAILLLNCRTNFFTQTHTTTAAV